MTEEQLNYKNLLINRRRATFQKNLAQDAELAADLAAGAARKLLTPEQIAEVLHEARPIEEQNYEMICEYRAQVWIIVHNYPLPHLPALEVMRRLALWRTVESNKDVLEHLNYIVDLMSHSSVRNYMDAYASLTQAILRHSKMPEPLSLKDAMVQQSLWPAKAAEQPVPPVPCQEEDNASAQ